MKRRMLLATAPLLFMTAMVRADSPLVTPTAGDFDEYVFAMSDENDFCSANPNKTECEPRAIGGSFGMALHGLWPDQSTDSKNTYQYCSPVTAKELGQDWCGTNLDIGAGLDPSVLQALTNVMPGTLSCLYNHEWYAHGTCSGLSPDDYFAMATHLATTFRAMPNFQGFITESAGQTVSKQQIMNALTLDLGAGAPTAAVFLCRKDTDNAYHFQEVDITLNLSNMMQFPDPSSLGQSKQSMAADGTLGADLGSCPTNGIIITPPAS